jgi:predicted dehydrogenase
MAERIRWGILSTGEIADRFTSDLRFVPDAEATAVGSRSVEAASAFAQRHGIARAHGSWRDLAEDPEVDVVYVATPHHAHHDAALMCLRAGKAVLCEKPFTLDRASSEELVGTARSADVFLMEAMWMRCFPAIHRIAGLIADGAIGQVTTVQADFGLSGHFAPTHRLRARSLGGGALLDLGVYPVTFAHLCLGTPASVSAWAHFGPEGTDENTGIVLGYESGAVAALTCSIIGDTARRAVITGTEGRIEVPRDFFVPSGFELWRGDTIERFDDPFEGLGYHFEAAEVQKCLRAGRIESDVVPLSETLAVMTTLDTIRAQIGLSYDG